MRIVSLAAAFAAVLLTAAAPASEIPPPDSNGVIDLTNMKFPRDVNPTEFRLPHWNKLGKNDYSVENAHKRYRDIGLIASSGLPPT